MDHGAHGPDIALGAVARHFLQGEKVSIWAFFARISDFGGIFFREKNHGWEDFEGEKLYVSENKIFTYRRAPEVRSGGCVVEFLHGCVAEIAEDEIGEGQAAGD